jgi:hypothetical protein
MCDGRAVKHQTVNEETENRLKAGERFSETLMFRLKLWSQPCDGKLDMNAERASDDINMMIIMIF